MKINYHILNDEWAWMQIPKVASTLISQNLKKQRKLKYEYLRMSSDNVKNLNRKIVFLTRNPYDRIISGYLNRVGKYHKLDNKQLLNTTWEQFVDKLIEIPHEKLDIHLQPIYRFEEAIKEQNPEVMWLKIEDPHSLDKIAEMASIKLNHNVFKNVTENRMPYREYYNTDLEEKISSYYKEDIIRYKYNF